MWNRVDWQEIESKELELRKENEALASSSWSVIQVFIIECLLGIYCWTPTGCALKPWLLGNSGRVVGLQRWSRWASLLGMGVEQEPKKSEPKPPVTQLAPLSPLLNYLLHHRGKTVFPRIPFSIWFWVTDWQCKAFTQNFESGRGEIIILQRLL